MLYQLSYAISLQIPWVGQLSHLRQSAVCERCVGGGLALVKCV
jgi:hypothetical protein